MKIPKKIAVRVTEADCKAGKRGNAHSCPIALALQRKLKLEEDRVTVDPGCVAILIEDERVYYSMTRDMCEFIKNFDNGDYAPPKLGSGTIVRA